MTKLYVNDEITLFDGTLLYLNLTLAQSLQNISF